MIIDLEHSTDSSVSISLVFTDDDIDIFIDTLRELKANRRDSHFHIGSNMANDKDKFLDIEFALQDEKEVSNAVLTGFAIEPNR